MSTVAELIRKHRDRIVDAWAGPANQAASARGLDRPELVNLLPTYLDALGHGAHGKGKKGARALEEHLGTRLRQGFHLAEIVEEIVLLGRCIVSSWAGIPQSDQPEASDISDLLAELQRDCAHVADLFGHHMLEEEQTEKRYLRLLDAAAAEHRASGAPLAELHHGLVVLVVEAMAAQTATLLIFDPADDRLHVAASVGVANELLQEYATSLATQSLGSRIAAETDGHPLEVSDVETTRFDVSETLRRSGIHSVLGTRLPQRNELIGVLYIGLSESRGFTMSESRRLAALSERIAIIVEAEALSDRLRATIERLEHERAMREQFVSLLAHDLRGPLSAATLATQVLARDPNAVPLQRQMTTRILRNLERTDRMVRDLLDANRIRAGQPLQLDLVSSDLREIAERVVSELVEAHGDRFTLVAPGSVRALWDVEQLRRAIWNLGMNAVKHGARDSEVKVTVEVIGDRARVSVHNTGPAIAPAAQARLFEPFARVGEGRRGWGLGLTLVRGSAEAHGGRVWVESTPESGTTFTMEMPLRS